MVEVRPNPAPTGIVLLLPRVVSSMKPGKAIMATAIAPATNVLSLPLASHAIALNSSYISCNNS